jgi:hypothetical protein
MIVLPGMESEFTGVYVAHWEMAHFAIQTGRKLFGLLPKRERWSAYFPKDFHFPGEDEQTKSFRYRPPRFFRIHLIGVPSERGQFGHKGICCRKIEIHQVLEISEKSDYKVRFGLC